VHSSASSLESNRCDLIFSVRRSQRSHAREGTGMRTHSRKTWPLFLLDAVLAAVGLFVLHGIAAGVLLFATLLAVIGTAIYALAGERVNDGCGGIGGGTSF
jgi:hypothetical protein